MGCARFYVYEGNIPSTQHARVNQYQKTVLCERFCKSYDLKFWLKSLCVRQHMWVMFSVGFSFFFLSFLLTRVFYREIVIHSIRMMPKPY